MRDGVVQHARDLFVDVVDQAASHRSPELVGLGDQVRERSRNLDVFCMPAPTLVPEDRDLREARVQARGNVSVLYVDPLREAFEPRIEEATEWPE